MNQLQNDNLKEREENSKFILEMEKPFSKRNIFLFILKRNYIGIFQFIAFSLPCFIKERMLFFSIFIIVMQIWILILVLKAYYIYRIEFDPEHHIIDIFSHYPLLKIKAKQEFHVKDVKIGKIQNRLAKIDAIEIITKDNQTVKFSLLDYEYSLKKENVNNFINKINQYL